MAAVNSTTMSEAATRSSASASVVFRNDENDEPANSSLATALDLWLDAIQAAIPLVGDAGGRTVLNWVPIGRELHASVTESLISAALVGTFLYRTCRAIEKAQDESRITTAQETSLLASWNAIWAY